MFSLGSFSLRGEVIALGFSLVLVLQPPVWIPNFSPPVTIPPAIYHIFMCIFGCMPLSPRGVQVFLMYRLTSRHLYMLIITKADVLKYSSSRVNIHKPLWDYWWVGPAAHASLIRKPSTRLSALFNSLCCYLDYCSGEVRGQIGLRSRTTDLNISPRRLHGSDKRDSGNKAPGDSVVE